MVLYVKKTFVDFENVLNDVAIVSWLTGSETPSERREGTEDPDQKRCLFLHQQSTMAATTPVHSLLLILVSFSLLLHLPCPFNTQKPLRPCNFNAIYQLGDSLSDTGNLIIQNPASRFARLPYGQTFFKKPTGRCSNGLLMIDYIGMNSETNHICFPFEMLIKKIPGFA